MNLDVQKVAVIGAGVAGVGAAVYLQRAGLDVTVYERNAHVGGIWVYDERIPRDAAFPSTLPSTGDSPEFEEWWKNREKRCDSPLKDHQHDGDVHEGQEVDSIDIDFAPPGPCYITLKNNVSTTEMRMACQAWKPGTEEYVLHSILADYLQDAAVANGVMGLISFNTRVNRVTKEDGKWKLKTARLETGESGKSIVESTGSFDAVVIATGHYHAMNVPDIKGLAELKRAYPTRVQHSKLYRRPEDFRGQNVLLIGAGVSSMDIARNLEEIAQYVYQSSRGGSFDVPSQLLPENGARVGGIEKFEIHDSGSPGEDGALPMTVHLRDGRRLCNIHQIFVCTGYHVSLPFMREYHADGVRPEDADETVLVTDGQQTHNLHQDIWYIPDPTLAFIGVPYHTATFSLFEFQSMALAAVYSGRAPLPSTADMRKQYLDRIEIKGAGRTFHSLRKPGEEVDYVDGLVRMVNVDGNLHKMVGHTQEWMDGYARRKERVAKLFGGPGTAALQRDPSLDANVVAAMSGC